MSQKKPIPKTPDRRRLSPEARKEMLLESTTVFLREHGLAALTMDKLAQSAGVSKPLVYNYFPNRMALLKAVLVREVELRLDLDRQVGRDATSLEDLIDRSSRTMLQHIQDRGNILQQLLQEPEVAQVLSDMRMQVREGYVDFIAGQVMERFALSRPVASIVVELVMGMGTAAGALFEREKGDVDQVHEILVTVTNGALEAAVRKYSSQTPARRKKKRPVSS